MVKIKNAKLKQYLIIFLSFCSPIHSNYDHDLKSLVNIINCTSNNKIAGIVPLSSRKHETKNYWMNEIKETVHRDEEIWRWWLFGLCEHVGSCSLWVFTIKLLSLGVHTHLLRTCLAPNRAFKQRKNTWVGLTVSQVRGGGVNVVFIW